MDAAEFLKALDHLGRPKLPCTGCPLFSTYRKCDADCMWAKMGSEDWRMINAKILDDGTLEVSVSHEELKKVNRVMVSDDRHWCKIFYQDARGEWKTAMLDHEAFGVRPTLLYCSCCSRCVTYPTRYCPNCGAKMESEE